MNKDSAPSLNHYCCSQLLEEHNKFNVDQFPGKKNNTTRYGNSKQIYHKFTEKIPIRGRMQEHFQGT